MGSIAALGAEKVQVSGSSHKVLYPDSVLYRKELEKLMNAPGSRLPEASAPNVPFIPPANDPLGGLPNKKLLELIDRSQNWMFLTPESLNKDLMSESTFGVRDYQKDLQGGRSSKVVQQYMDSLDKSAANRGSKEPGTNGTSDVSLNRLSMTAQKPEGLLDTIKTPESNAGGVAKSNNLPGLQGPNSLKLNPGIKYNELTAKSPIPGTGVSPDASFSTLLRTVSGFRDGNAQSTSWQPGRDFQRLLHPEKPGLLLGGPNDPVNLVPDATRNAMQPIIPNALDDFKSAKDKRDPFAQVSQLGVPGRNRFFDDLNVRAFGPASLPLVATPPAPLPLPEPKPGMFIVPKLPF